MRRTALKRNPEKVRDWQRRSRVRLARTRRTLDANERAAKARFDAAVQGRACVVCGTRRSEMTGHHAIEAQFLRGSWPEFEWDPRNAVPVCPWWVDAACHGDHHAWMRRIPRGRLPASVETFADDLGLRWYLDRFYGPRRATGREGPGGDAL